MHYHDTVCNPKPDKHATEKICQRPCVSVSVFVNVFSFHRTFDERRIALSPAICIFVEDISVDDFI